MKVFALEKKEGLDEIILSTNLLKWTNLKFQCLILEFKKNLFSSIKILELFNSYPLSFLKITYLPTIFFFFLRKIISHREKYQSSTLMR